MWGLIWVLTLILLSPKELGAFQAGPHKLRPVDAVLSAGWLSAYAVPHLFDLNDHPPSCVPCDRQSVPAFDRWAIVQPKDALSAASSGIVFALAALESLDLARGGPEHYG